MPFPQWPVGGSVGLPSKRFKKLKSPTARFWATLVGIVTRPITTRFTGPGSDEWSTRADSRVNVTTAPFGEMTYPDTPVMNTSGASGLSMKCPRWIRHGADRPPLVR